MRKYVLYIFVLALGIALYFVTRGDRSETLVFYGFSENKEQELNFDYDVKVVEIMVNSGQHVNLGDPLLKVERTSDPMRFSEIENKIALIQLRKNASLLEVQNDINTLKSDEATKLIELENDIKSYESSIARNKALLNVIDDLNIKIDSTLKGDDQLKIEEAKSIKSNIKKATKLEISMKNSQLNTLNAEFDLELANLEQEMDFYVAQEKNHILKAPTDAIVGFINCNPGENYSSFSKLLSLYDPHPQLVKGYILESMITSIEIDDPVMVSSALDPSKSYPGVVSGFGTRIMEIPNRLSKVPELTMYGREVLITIPAENDLLQKEKVKVTLLKSEEKSSLSQKISNV